MSCNRLAVHAAILTCFVAAMQLQTRAFRSAKSITYDETFYLACATNTVVEGRVDESLVHHGAAPLPVLVNSVPAVLAHSAFGFPVEQRRYRWGHAQGDPMLVNTARLINSWVVGTGLLVTVYLWLFLAHRTTAAVSGALLVTFSPTIVSHCSVATTDSLAALCWLLGLIAIMQFGRGPSVFRSAAAGAVAGLAVSAKYSAVTLGIVFLLVLLLAARKRSQQTANTTTMDAAIWLFVFGYVAFLATWATHGFAMAQIAQAGVYTLPADSWMTFLQGVQLPAPIAGILNQQLHNLDPQPAMLLGEVSKQGWWYYYPVALAIKATPGEAVVVLLGLAVGLWQLAGNRRATEERLGTPSEEQQYDSTVSGWTATVWGLTLVVGAALIPFVRVQIGIRYLLPLAVVAILFGSSRLAWLMDRIRHRAIRHSIAGVWVIALVGQIATAVQVAPHYLAYVAPYWGGPSEGYRWLADSNVDWGQDLPALKRVLDRLPSDRVVLSYFGTADPSAYNIEATSLDQVRQDSRATLADYDYLAVSINHLYGLDGSRDGGESMLDHLRHETPIARAGHSICVYDLQRQP